MPKTTGVNTIARINPKTYCIGYILPIFKLNRKIYRNISTAVIINPKTPPAIACAIVCFFKVTLDQITIGYSNPNNAPTGPKRMINAQTGPLNPVV